MVWAKVKPFLGRLQVLVAIKQLRKSGILEACPVMRDRPSLEQRGTS